MDFHILLPTVILLIFTSHVIQKMGMAHIWRVILKILIKLTHILYVPVYIKRIFVRSKKCPPIDNNILLLPAVTLAEKIRKRQITCEAAVKAYIQRIKQVDPIINAVVEDRFEDAIKDAIETDYFLNQNKLSESELHERYPLLGVPITIKSSIALKGLAYNAGSWLRDVKAEDDAVVVKMVKEAGAVPLLVSNTPELCMNWETTNKVMGTTLNPYNTTRTAGGSSGGECALLAAAASVIGIGSDIAGSLRLPAHFCGVWGHKPSPGAVPLDGHFPGCEDPKIWEEVFTLGPLARYVEDLALLLKCIIKPEIRPVLKLDEPVDLSTIKVYYIENYGSVLFDKINNNVECAMHKVIAHLATVCKGEPEKVDGSLMRDSGENSYLHLLSIDGIENVFKGKGEGVYTEMFKYFTCRSKYTFVPIAYGLYKRLLCLLFTNHIDTVKENIKELRNYLTKILDKNAVFITPSFVNEAHPHGDIYKKIFNGGYLSVFNSLGFPVTNCPVFFTKDGLPVGVQVAAAPNCDRLTLAIAREIERVFGGWQAPNHRIPTVVT